MTYKIVRHFFHTNRRARTIKRGLTLAEAQAHCQNQETSSETATSAYSRRYTERNGPWFDGYEEEKPRRACVGNPPLAHYIPDCLIYKLPERENWK